MNDVDILLGSYGRIVLSANKTLNLVSRRSVDRLLPDLISESLIPLSWNSCRLGSPLLDIGSGGGFPGMPLKISRPDLSVTLLDANRKKILFLKSAIHQLQLTDAEAIWMRCEEFAGEGPNQLKYRTITVRAVGDFDMLIQSAVKLLMPEGEFIIWLSSVPELRASSMLYFDLPDILFPQDGLVLLNFRRNFLPVSSQ